MENLQHKAESSVVFCLSLIELNDLDLPAHLQAMMDLYSEAESFSKEILDDLFTIITFYRILELKLKEEVVLFFLSHSNEVLCAF